MENTLAKSLSQIGCLHDPACGNTPDISAQEKRVWEIINLTWSHSNRKQSIVVATKSHTALIKYDYILSYLKRLLYWNYVNSLIKHVVD